ncbi:MAG: multidrug ABC transporter ATP-binding protein [Anaerolineaceae bacterium]|nr:multidrug ABC transporter ATP-binding protein [Anaerolineaceae bacterium]
MNDSSIIADQLVYRYKELTAVDHISFEVARGEVFSFLGPNGAGKSTTVKMLTGELRPAQGKATLLGIDVSKQPSKVHAQIGVAFEIANLYEEMSGIENLNLFAQLFGIKHFDANALLARVGLDGRGKEHVSNYSKGMKQRLMIARALVNKPRILFLDEPTDGLDPVSSETIRGIIREEANNGTTVFLTTHNMVEADKVSNRVAFINKGKIVALDTPHKLKQQYGKRALKVEIECPDGTLERHDIVLDQTETPQVIHDLFANQRVVTVHSEEATLEDIFIQFTGRGLT